MTEPPAQIGMPIDQVDTPALVIELDAFDHNLATMRQAIEGTGIRVRPHAKTHKSAAIARRQIAEGAVGVCCQKVGEAEALVAAGITDVLVSNEIVGAAKVARLARLAAQARIGVCVDHPAQVDALSAAAVAAGTTLGVLVEIDVGAGRCGLPPGPPAVELAAHVAAARNLRFDGLQAYYGSAQHLREPAERAQATASAATKAGWTVKLLQAKGLTARIVGGAGTGTFRHEAASGVFTELQPGSYIFMDGDYAANRRAADDPQFRHSLFVLATVMSVPAADRAVLDAGLKAVAVDSGLPRVADRPGLTVKRCSDEHATVAVEGPMPALGEKLRLIPGHCDPTVNLHDWYVGVRNGIVEAIWPIEARGAIR